MLFLVSSMINTYGISQEFELPNSAIDCLINCINNHSVLIQPKYFQDLDIDSVAKYLVKKPTEYLIVRLIENIVDTNKTIICHIMLTKIFELTLNKFQIDFLSNYSEHIIEYKFNDFIWREIINRATYSEVKLEFDQSQIPKLLSHWIQYRGKLFKFKL